MAKYRIWAKSIDYCYIDVEADNEAKAMKIYVDADGGDFHTDSSVGDWEFDRIDNLDDDASVDYVDE